MLADVAPAAGRGVVTPEVNDQIDQPPGESRPDSPVVHRLLSEVEKGEQGNQVRAVPVSIHIRLAEADIGSEHGALKEPVPDDVHRHLRRTIGVTKNQLLAIGQGHGHPAMVELAEKTGHHPASQPLQQSRRRLPQGQG
jgi:hypothetical protein